MNIVSIKNKAVQALFDGADPAKVKGLAPAVAKKIYQQMSFLEAADTIKKVADSFVNWKVHELTPRYPGKWSLTVTGNWRLTFYLDKATGEITDMDYEDYH